MDSSNTTVGQQRTATLYRIAPGLGLLAAYQRDWLGYDLVAGVSVAAVALPTAIAYAQIIGLAPVAGLYAAIPAMLAYAVFGTSRHLIVNPDAATCAMIAATLAPLAGGDQEVLLSMSVVLAILTGLFCFAAIGLFDVASLRRLWRVSRSEFGIAVATMLGVVALDVWQGILLAVALALLLLLKRSARPPDAVVGRIPGMKGFHDLGRHPDAVATPGLLIYRFGAGIVFFNASYLKKRILDLATAEPGLKWIIIDGSTVNTIDSTGADTIQVLAGDLAGKGIRLGLAGFHTETQTMLRRTGALEAIGADTVYPTLKAAMNAFQEFQSPPPADVARIGSGLEGVRE